MTKEQMSGELEAAKRELEALKTEAKALNDGLTAISAARSCAGDKSAAEVLDELFEFDNDGYCLGFNETAVKWYCWKAQEPPRA